MAFKFEQLEVWQKALEMSTQVHELTQKFPKEEMYVLAGQIKRSADSVALNIAEGSTGQTNAEFRQFVGYALRSAIEVVGCLHLGKKRGIIATTQFQKLYADMERIVRMLQGLRKSLK